MLLDVISKNAGLDAASNDKYEQRERTYSVFKEKDVPDRGETRVCPDVGVEVGDEQITSVMDGTEDFDKAPACKKQSAAGRR